MSPVGVRCARLELASGLDFFVPTMAAWFVGGALGFATTFAVIALHQGLLSGPPATVWMRSIEAFKGLPPPSFMPLAMVVLACYLPPRIARFLFDLRVATLTREKRRQQSKMRRKAKGVLVIAILVPLVLFMVSALIGPWQAAAMMAATYSAANGLATVTGALVARRGRFLVCAKCAYPMQSWRSASPQCPECGNHWQHHWRARLGKRTITWRWLFLGFGLLVVSGLLIAAVGRWGL